MSVYILSNGDNEVKINYRGNDEFYTRGGDDVVRSRAEGNYDIDLGSGNDTYIGNGYAWSGSNYDRVWGGLGDDTFVIRTNHSDYYGGDGNDTFRSVGYNNLISGGAGRDMLSYAIQDDEPGLSGKGVTVNLAKEYATSGGYRLEDVISIEDVIGTKAGDRLIGNAKGNWFQGMSGNDRLEGWSGNDKLEGGAGADVLFGGLGNDWLTGGAGLDKMAGNGGADVFIFKAASDSVTGAQDIIADFVSGVDRINLTEIDANTGTAGVDDAFTFIDGAAFSNTAGELRYAGGVLQGDINGDGVADFAVTLTGAPTVLSTDFLL